MLPATSSERGALGVRGDRQDVGDGEVLVAPAPSLGLDLEALDRAGDPGGVQAVNSAASLSFGSAWT